MLKMGIFNLQATEQVGVVRIEVVQALGDVAHLYLLPPQNGSRRAVRR
jgi:hypothetical protein